MFADIINELAKRFGPRSADEGLVSSPSAVETEGTTAGKVLDPMTMQQQMIPPPPGTVTNDAGTITDYQPGNPFAKLLQGGEQGTIRNLLQRMISPTPERNQPGSVQGFGTVGGGDPNRGTPGTGIDPGLDRTPTKNQRVPGLAPKAMSNPYEQPSAMNPQQIDELRNSILEQTGQLDPNSLSGRMSGPNASVDQHNQMNDAQRQHDSLRGFDGSRSQRMKKSEADGSFQVAGDVVPLHPPGTFSSNTQKGDVVNGLAKSLGVPPPKNVIPFKIG